MGDRITLAALEELARAIFGGGNAALAPVDRALRAEMDEVWNVSGELARQVRKQCANRSASFSLEPVWLVRDDATAAWAEAALRETLIGRGITIHEGLSAPRRLPGVRAAYVPMLRRIELGPGHDLATRLSLLAHEGAHALTVGGIRHEALAEVVAETTAYLVTKPYIRPANADSHLYIAVFAAQVRAELDDIWDRAAPHVAKATTALREGIAAWDLPQAA